MHLFNIIKEKYFIFLLSFSKNTYSTKEILSRSKKSFKKSNQTNINLFKKKGLICVSCEKKGSFFIKKGDAFLLYTSDNILMTKDHIIPKARGGSNCLSNLQPMCQECNLKKADNLI